MNRERIQRIHHIFIYRTHLLKKAPLPGEESSVSEEESLFLGELRYLTFRQLKYPMRLSHPGR